MGLLSRVRRRAPSAHDDAEAIVAHPARSEMVHAAASTVEATEVTMRSSSAGEVNAAKVMMNRSSARTVTASDDVTMTFSGAARVSAGGDMISSNSGAALMTAGRDLRLESGGAGVIAASDARIESGSVGVLLARSATLGDGARVLVGTREVLLIVAGIAVLLPLARALLRRFFPPPRQTEQVKRPLPVRIGLWLLGLAIRVGLLSLAGWLAWRWVRGRARELVPAALRGA